LVVDLSSLWAGPLCASLFAHLGARVVKVEARHRPDGARNGNSTFYDLLNGDKESVAFDFSSPRDLADLVSLLRHADIVVESARPRALLQLGINAEELVRERAGQTWIRITGHAHCQFPLSRAGFGDDCAVEAGLSWLMHRAFGAPLFCGDAIADPLTGLHAALAGWASYQAGGGRVIELALADVVAHCIAATPADDPTVGARLWHAMAMDLNEERFPARRPHKIAPRMGAHTHQVLAELLC
jgi:crotonobetainyl-CoA:carnitine CoA-transferase CaiB-like acyl-CoA transferase